MLSKSYEGKQIMIMTMITATCDWSVGVGDCSESEASSFMDGGNIPSFSALLKKSADLFRDTEGTRHVITLTCLLHS